ncbi:aldo/keto reductase [Pseudarthrobacter oxydans]|uniref:aldo/keto reductase n=1 Tax=Pseudarthrobacter oxydans TaxID=1671 RepID=UPI00344ED09D
MGIGTWAMGGGQGGSSNLGSTDDHESIAAVHRGLDLGFNWIDTAAYYGFGHSEEIVARALKGMKEPPYVFTKCGLVPAEGGQEAHEFRLKAWSVRAEVEASLSRLRTEVLDLVMLHWPIPDEDVEEGWEALYELQQQGKVRFIGVSNFSVEQLKRCEQITHVDVHQVEYSLINRLVQDNLLPFAEAKDIGVLAYSPLKHGLLSGSMTRERVAALEAQDWRNGHPQYSEPLLSENLRVVEVLRTIAKRHCCSPAEVAIAWTLAGTAVAGAIVGGRRPSQFTDIVGAGKVELSNEDLAELER